jgi:hypothetical protein
MTSLRDFSVLKSMTAVFTLLTISIGEEFNFKFFKIISCVSRESVYKASSKLTLAGLDGNMCRAMDCCRDQNGEACY